MRMRFLVCEPYRLIYRPLPKCASTTLFNLFADLGDSRRGTGPRDNLPFVTGVPPSDLGGSYVVACPIAALGDLSRRFADHVWFSVVRDPYDRVVSNYLNKLNRYARRFASRAYAWGYLAPLVHGRLAWPDQSERARWLRRLISFDDFVEGLAQHGTGWDSHVQPQTAHLHADLVRYHRLIKMERLAAGLGGLLADVAGPDRARAAIARLGCHNRSERAETADPWTPATRAIVADAYRGDFEPLGYAA